MVVSDVGISYANSHDEHDRLVYIPDRPLMEVVFSMVSVDVSLMIVNKVAAVSGPLVDD
jgi:hypothetical protein